MRQFNRTNFTAAGRVVIAAVLLAFFTLSNASALGLSPYTSIKEISVGTGNKPIFRLDTPGDAGTGCANGVWIRFPDLAAYEGNRRIYNLVVTALMNNKTVLVETQSCDEAYPLLHRIWIK
ncbi:MAG: hypothetical protein KJO55_00720 [Gammaproteobacteria bacterium]|nr:hypothetical protein [Gammaproteobacteria bacterium]